MIKDIKKTIEDYKEKVINCDIKISSLEENKKNSTTEHKRSVVISLIREEERVRQSYFQAQKDFEALLLNE